MPEPKRVRSEVGRPSGMHTALVSIAAIGSVLCRFYLLPAHFAVRCGCGICRSSAFSLSAASPYSSGASLLFHRIWLLSVLACKKVPSSP